MIEIAPMDEAHLDLPCLHDGPIDIRTCGAESCESTDSLPVHPWSDDVLRRVALDHPIISHGNSGAAGREFKREMIRRYGTCALLARDGNHVVGTVRFYPMQVARLIASSQVDPSPLMDCAMACEPDEDVGTLWVHCVMTSRPHACREDARPAGARRGLGLRLVGELIRWAGPRGWKRIVKVAHCDLDWFYGMQGGGGRAFWEKAGFQVAGSFCSHVFDLTAEHEAILHAQADAKGMTEREIWTWYRMVYAF